VIDDRLWMLSSRCHISWFPLILNEYKTLLSLFKGSAIVKCYQGGFKAMSNWHDENFV